MQAGSHCDFETITLLFAKGAGLEVCPGREATSQHAMGDEWTPCPAIPGTITGWYSVHLIMEMHVYANASQSPPEVSVMTSMKHLDYSLMQAMMFDTLYAGSRAHI